MKKEREIFVQLLDEGIDVYRPIQAVEIDKNIYQILQSNDYDPETETWEFLPGSVVRCELIKSDQGEDFLAAVEYIHQS